MTEKCTIFTFTHVRQTCFAYYFFWCIFSQLFQRIRNQREILRFLTPFLIKKKKFFLGHCTALRSAEFFIEPPPDTQRKRRRGERGMGVAMGCYLSHASPSPPSPLPHRASVAPPHSGTEVILVREGPRAGGAPHSGKRGPTISRLL